MIYLAKGAASLSRAGLGPWAFPGGALPDGHDQTAGALAAPAAGPGRWRAPLDVGPLPESWGRGRRGDAWAEGPWRRPKPAVCARCGSEPRPEFSVAVRLAQGGCSAAPTGIPSPYLVPCLVACHRALSLSRCTRRDVLSVHSSCMDSPAWTGLGSGASRTLRLACHGLEVPKHLMLRLLRQESAAVASADRWAGSKVPGQLRLVFVPSRPCRGIRLSNAPLG